MLPVFGPKRESYEFSAITFSKECNEFSAFAHVFVSAIIAWMPFLHVSHLKSTQLFYIIYYILYSIFQQITQN
jgi:hypothetical protein